jgi:cytochrome P450
LKKETIMIEPSTLAPKTCPHLGEAFQPFVNPQLDDPYSFYKQARRDKPIFFSPLFNAYVLTRYDDILTVLKDPVRFSSANSLQSVQNYTPEVIDVLRQGFPIGGLVFSDGDLHKRLRTPLLKALAPERLQMMEGSICAIANRLVNQFIHDGHADILAQFAYPLTLEVIFTMLGVPLDKMTEVKEWGSASTDLFSSQLTPERQIDCARKVVALQRCLMDLVEERRIAPRNDFISELQAGDLTMLEVAQLSMEMIVAGHKTTANLIGTALKLLLERDGLWQALCNDASLIPAALEEALRYDTPALSMIRMTTEAVNLGGVDLPKDTRVLILYGSANHDEAQYRNADRFEIDRFKDANANHLAFSHGIHHCTGAGLARREGRIALAILSARLPNLRLRPNQRLTYAPAMLNRGFTALEVEWDVA